MCIICRTKNIRRILDNLTDLCCFNCPNITTIPKTMINLTSLNCAFCPNLTTIPKTLININMLNCSNCPNLTTIPKTLIHLIKLSCNNCPNLTTIPKTLINLIHLSCYECSTLTTIPNRPWYTTAKLECFGCTWLHESINYNYNISKLIQIQKIFIKYRRKKINNYIGRSLPNDLKNIILGYYIKK